MGRRKKIKKKIIKTTTIPGPQLMKCSCCGSRRIVDNFLPGLGSKCQRCVHGLSPRSSNGKGTKSKNDTQIALRAEWKSKVQNFNNEEDHHHSTGFHNLAKGLTNLWNRSSRYEILKLPLLKPNQCNNFLKYAKQKISTRARDPCVEEIIFGYSEGDRTHRFMVPVATIARAKESYGITNKLQKNEIVFERKNMPKDVTTIVESVSQQLVELNPTIKDIKWLFLISEKGCEKQVSHCDNNVFTTYMEGRKRNNRLGFNVPFSVLCALEDSDKNPTHLYLHSTTKNKDSYEDRRVTLSRGGCAIFRGDQWHSGSEYDKLNIRLFIGVGTYACPYESEDVYYFENEETDEEEEDHVIKVNN